MNNFQKRSISGIIYGVIATVCILCGKYSFFGLLLLLQILCQREFYHLAEKDNAQPHKITGFISGALLFICAALFSIDKVGASIFIIPFLSLYIIYVESLYKKDSRAFINIGYTILGVLYICAPFAAFTFVAFCLTSTYSAPIIMGVMILLWTYDTFAYIAGSFFGQIKLFKRISPGKTWEGVIGGTMACLFVSPVTALCTHELSPVKWITISLIVVVTGTFGDLYKSLLKRSVAVKDTGNIIPGHGGILDRLDSLLFASSFILAYLIMIKTGLID